MPGNCASRCHAMDSSRNNDPFRLPRSILPNQSSAQMTDQFSLNRPRPTTDRYSNEYIDSPNKPTKKREHLNASSPKHDDVCKAEKDSHRFDAPLKKDPLSTDHFLTKQPRLPDSDFHTLKKPSTPCAIHGPATGHQAYNEEEKNWKPLSITRQPTAEGKKPNSSGIICPECGECRCAACLSPKELPKKWILNGRIEVSADSIVDTLSCMCLVKSCLYHCTNYRANDDVVKEQADEDPCTCSGSHCFPIWSCMSVAALTCLPCLLCYWPMRTCLDCCSKCYASASRRGCRCPSSSSSTCTSSTATRKSSTIPLTTVVSLTNSSPSSSADSSPVTSLRVPARSPRLLTPPPRPPKPNVGKPGYAIRINPQSADVDGAFSCSRDFR